MSNATVIPVQALPFNALTGKPYGGGNIDRLLDQGYTSPLWATYKQWQSLGYQVQKVQKVGKGTKLAFFKQESQIVIVDGQPMQSADTKKVIHGFTVFNIAQVEQIIDDQTPELPPMARCESIVYENRAD